jgi:hypothetical protein
LRKTFALFVLCRTHECRKRRGEPEKDKGPVDLCPGERARPDVEPWLSSGAGLRSDESAGATAFAVNLEFIAGSGGMSQWPTLTA